MNDGTPATISEGTIVRAQGGSPPLRGHVIEPPADYGPSRPGEVWVNWWTFELPEGDERHCWDYVAHREQVTDLAVVAPAIRGLLSRLIVEVDETDDIDGLIERYTAAIIKERI